MLLRLSLTAAAAGDRIDRTEVATGVSLSILAALEELKPAFSLSFDVDEDR